MDWRLEAEKLAQEVERLTNGFEYHKGESARKTVRIEQLVAENHVLQHGLKDSRAGTPSQKAWNSLLKLVVGMAIAVYGFNPRDKRSNVPSDIQSDLDLKGISLDADTIRKRLREGARLIESAEDLNPKTK